MKQNVIVIDIDNTLCYTPSYKSLEEFSELDHLHFLPKTDVITAIAQLVYALKARPVILTSRSRDLCTVTLKWLEKHVVFYNTTELHMRPWKNKDSPVRLKRGLISKQLLVGIPYFMYQVVLVIDDDLEILDMLSRIGYNCCHPDYLLQLGA